MKDGFWYLATPYTKYHAGIDKAFEDACWVCARLIEVGLSCYSPIAHTHPVAIHGRLDPKNHALWMAVDAPMIRAAKGLIVCQMKGWEESKGVLIEIEEFKRAGKPIFYLKPDDLVTHP